jgi:hypothetical protein
MIVVTLLVATRIFGLKLKLDLNVKSSDNVPQRVHTLLRVGLNFIF